MTYAYIGFDYDNAKDGVLNKSIHLDEEILCTKEPTNSKYNLAISINDEDNVNEDLSTFFIPPNYSINFNEFDGKVFHCSLSPTTIKLSTTDTKLTIPFNLLKTKELVTTKKLNPYKDTITKEDLQRYEDYLLSKKKSGKRIWKNFLQELSRANKGVLDKSVLKLPRSKTTKEGLRKPIRRITIYKLYRPEELKSQTSNILPYDQELENLDKDTQEKIATYGPNQEKIQKHEKFPTQTTRGIEQVINNLQHESDPVFHSIHKMIRELHTRQKITGSHNIFIKDTDNPTYIANLLPFTVKELAPEERKKFEIDRSINIDPETQQIKYKTPKDLISPITQGIFWADNQDIKDLQKEKLPLKHLKKRLAEVPENWKGKRIDPNLERFIASRFYKEMKDSKHILVNSDSEHHRAGFAGKYDPNKDKIKWNIITHKINPSSVEAEKSDNYEHLKKWLTPINNKTRLSHYLDFIYGKIKEMSANIKNKDDEVNTLASKFKSRKSDNNQNKWIKGEEELEKLKKDRNSLGALLTTAITGIRPGWNTQSRNEGWELAGVNTLTNGHVQLDKQLPNKVHIRFSGKHDILHTQTYDDHRLHDLFKTLQNENESYTNRNLEGWRKNHPDSIKSKQELLDNLPLLNSHTNDNQVVANIKNHTGEFLKGLKDNSGDTFTDEDLDKTKHYDFRRLAFNIMAHESAKHHAQDYYKRTRTAEPKDDDIKQMKQAVYNTVSMKSNNSPATLRSNYIMLGLVEGSLRWHLHNEDDKSQEKSQEKD